MNLLFDEESQKLIVNAKKEMYELKHPYVGSEHLLLAILHNQQLDITKLLNKYGIYYTDFKNEIISSIGIGSKENNWFLFTPLLKKVLMEATYTAKDNNKCVTPYDLVFIILEEGDGVANRILIGMNIDIEALSEKIAKYPVHYPVLPGKLFLDDYAINMNERCIEEKYDPVIGREKELDQVIQILIRKNKNNPLLIGEAGVGKTAIVEALTQKIIMGDVPEKLKNKTIYSISMSVLISGTKYRGEFEEKFHKIIEEVINNSDIILFIDEIHTVIGAGGAEGAIDASNIIKPYLARGEFQVIGATTTYEYSKYIEKDKALARRFQKINVMEPKEEDLVNILKGLVPIYEKFHSVKISKEIFNNIISFSTNYYPGKQPDKMIDLLDEVCAYASINHNEVETLIKKYTSKIREVELAKNKAIIAKDFKKATLYRNKEKKLRSAYNSSLYKNKKDLVCVISLEDLYQVIYSKIKLPLGNILIERKEKSRKSILKDLYGSKETVIKILSSIEKNINDISKPFSLLFVGKNGVGKTFLAEKVVSNLFDSSVFFKVDLSDYDRNNILSDSDDNPFNKVKRQPFMVYLIEGLEKASINIKKELKQIISEGTIKNEKGEILNFKNCLFIITVPICSTLGFGQKNYFPDSVNKLKNIVTDTIWLPDIESKNIKNLLIKKLGDITSLELARLVEESDYNNCGYKKIDSLVKDYLEAKSVKI